MKTAPRSHSSRRLLFAVRLCLSAFLASPALADSTTVLAGQTVTLSLTAEGTAPFVYQWFKDGVAVTGATGATHAISNFQAATAGIYTASATNSAGSTTSGGATLVLAAPPVIVAQPVSKTVLGGGSVTFAVVATGTPALTYQWRKNGVSITGATASSYAIAKVVDGSTGSGGNYSVVVSNSIGSVTSSNAVLTVTKASQAPIIKTQPASMSVFRGASVTFSISVSASPAPTYQWRKSGVNITGATASSYKITSASPGDVGTYSVVVKNTAGTVTSSNATLTVKPVVHADFNGDSKSDVLWQNILTGQHAVWLMSGITSTSTATLSTQSTDWSIVGLGDFSGDGKNDILRQNLVTGEVSLWVMSGTTLSSTVSLGIPAAGSFVTGAGDFNGDGRPDILWHSASNREYSIRLMNGTVAGATISLGAFDSEWRMAGTGDFNGDGKTDILWERDADGAIGLWWMNGGACVGWADLAKMGGDWRAGGTGDFNGDGKPDILWQDEITGARKVGLMNGVTRTAEASLGTMLPEWFICN